MMLLKDWRKARSLQNPERGEERCGEDAGEIRFGFYIKNNGKLMKDFLEEGDMIKFVFIKMLVWFLGG